MSNAETHRENLLAEAKKADGPWDVLVIGGGATGLGVALDAVSRGLTVLLVERGDFAQETSSRSTKLIHGGVRYLEFGDVGLVREGLQERKYLLSCAPHLVSTIQFIIPAYRIGRQPYYSAGLKLYDLLAGTGNIRKSESLTREETVFRVENLRNANLRGAVVYSDGQFDDSALATAIARTIIREGGVALNHVRMKSLCYERDRISGAMLQDELEGSEWEVGARCVVNATGIFADSLIHDDDETQPSRMSFSRGSHIVFPATFYPSKDALLIPKTDDGRILFCIPWKGVVLAGTTEIPVPEFEKAPNASSAEIEYLLSHLARYLQSAPKKNDIISVFAGIRPLVGRSGNTARLSRHHQIVVSRSGLISILGGKWTTFRKMGEDTIDRAIQEGLLETSESRSLTIPISKFDRNSPTHAAFSNTDRNSVPTREMIEIAVRTEMACTVEDFLARRSRAVFCDASGAIEQVEFVAESMAKILGKDDAWIDDQVHRTKSIFKNFLPEIAN